MTSSTLWLRATHSGEIILMDVDVAIRNLGAAPSLLDVEAAVHVHVEGDETEGDPALTFMTDGQIAQMVEPEDEQGEPNDTFEPDTLKEARGDA